MMELLPIKGRYEPGETIALTFFCDHSIDRITLCIKHLEQTTATLSFPAAPGVTRLSLPALPKGGYGIEAVLYDEESAFAEVSTAVNVDGDMVRYGFLSDFLPEDDADVARMAAYHMDHVQFYDWSYRHDTLVAPSDEYTDMMGKRNSLSAIRKKIASCHAHGMRAMAYGAVYAAGKAFRDAHATWGLYAPEKRPLVFIGTFYLMNISSAWREHLFKQYIDAISRMGFDGIHMDTYGEPKRALSESGETVELDAALPALIQDAAAAIKKAGHTPHLIFNNVGTWPVSQTRNAAQEAIYMELWPPMDRYRHLRQAVALAGTAQPVVLAAYPAPFRTDTPERALWSELILSFAIALCGATQLFLGENNAVVTQGYYADYTVLLPWQAERIRAYQDFFVRYQDLLFDASLRDVSLTHSGGDNQEYRCEAPCTLEGEPGRIWLTLREEKERRLIGLINLCGQSDDHWNTGKAKPIIQHGIVLHVLCLRPPEHVWFASPDEQNGATQELDFRSFPSDNGLDVEIRINRLDIAGLVWMR